MDSNDGEDKSDDENVKELKNSQEENPKAKLVLNQEIRDMTRGELFVHITAVVDRYYSEPLKPLQMQTVINLVHRQNTFVLAGTGFGKTRIAEVYWHLFPAYKKPIILVLNPLDTLGDNQVAEKKTAKINSVNLTKMNMTPAVEKKVLRGDYGFVYLSPKVLLNNPMFRRIFFDKRFQSHLVMTVVDEAHMIYIWGLVASGLGKKITSHLKLQDRGIFRPSYGDLGARLLAAHGVPILLLSATCRPIAIDKILGSLKVLPENMSFVRGELTRPEIRLIRVPMESSLCSCNDLKRVFGPQSEIADTKIPPTLIYSPTRNLTWQGLKVVNEAREIRGGHHDPWSTFSRRFHSTTGDVDKFDIIEGFERQKFPVISCTMALGLGQNWKRVQRVVHLGRGDPSSICQMIGRCGRGEDNPGLGVILVEKNRRKGKNQISDFPDYKAFSNGYIPSDDDRMDALAITPVCLRVVFNLDNMLGYVPLHNSDPNVMSEKKREADNNFPPCLCSNCDPKSAENLILALKHLTVDNFKENILNRELTFAVPVPPPPPKVTKPQLCITKKTGKHRLHGELENLAVALVERFQQYFNRQIDAVHSEFRPRGHFKLSAARQMTVAYQNGYSLEQLEKLIGGEVINGQMVFLHAELEAHVKTQPFLNYLEEVQLASGRGGTQEQTLQKRKAARARRLENAAQKAKKAEEASIKAAELAKNRPEPTRRSQRTIEHKRKKDEEQQERNKRVKWTNSTNFTH
ncbi:hypothetical protein MJO28_005791 [Puccinia striiformis f. sp. tritici]|uniref:Uncharacterized protein n=1 Tax=Puccinia striiformis f. sp. tritici TaxID=168172 RepID=A0ACC0EPQ6_9BASI|nr:hypothetical protein MJO28_005791 [Puccinia striiformis f. sp. tritici]KAI7960732.1 hypothetical protein MJO29_005800 [Puccinia striiformis f. sp. tritici]